MGCETSKSDVLIVDDDDGSLRTLSSLLRLHGLLPRPVRSGRLAIEAALAEPPKLILLDIRMPDLSGLEVCRQLLQDERLRQTPVIFLSGIGEVAEKVEAFHAGAVDYIVKPFQREEVIARVLVHLQLSAVRAEVEAQNRRLLTEQRQLQERLEAVVSTARDAIIMIDGEGRISHWNTAAEGMFGYSRVEAEGRDLHRLLAPPRFHDPSALGLEAFRRTGAGVAVGKTLELIGRRRSGEEFPLELSLAATQLQGDWCAVGLVRDISKRKKAEGRLREEEEKRSRMEVELRHSQKLEAVGRLAAGIAHEINTPVQFVSDSIQFLQTATKSLFRFISLYQPFLSAPEVLAALRDAADAVRAAEHELDLEYLLANVPGSIERCFDGTRRISAIVRAMKEFAHADLREKSPADLNHALESTLVIAKNEYKYVADIGLDLGEIPLVMCHLGDLNQVFLNLIVNAAHAIGEVVGDSGRKGVIRVATHSDDGSVYVEIADTGAGIPAEVREHIFEPFFTTKPVGKGTGQGLALARSIVVERHGGSLEFESTVGRGTTFTVRLPIDGTKSDQEGRPE